MPAMCVKSVKIVENALKKIQFKKVFIKNSQKLLLFSEKYIIITDSKRRFFCNQM